MLRILHPSRAAFLLILTLLFFFSITIYVANTFTSFDWHRENLSLLGDTGENAWLFNLGIIVSATAMLVAIFILERKLENRLPSKVHKITDHILRLRLKYRRIPFFIAIVSLMNLILTGAVSYTMNPRLHDISAQIYFFGIAVAICNYCIAYWGISPQFAKLSGIFTVLITLSSIILISAIPGLAAAEIAHILLVILWLIWVVYE